MSDNNKTSTGRLLTYEEWSEVTVPFHWLKIDFPEWGDLEYEIALKVALKHATGWVYFDKPRWVFEKIEDYVFFTMWLNKRPMRDGEALEIR